MLFLGGGVRYIWDYVYLFDYFVDLIYFFYKSDRILDKYITRDCDFMTI